MFFSLFFIRVYDFVYIMGFDKNLFEDPYELEAMAELSEPVLFL